ncbi:MAG TPA: hypothetical protein VNV66_04600 [Pilimelia sp.]|nr:hypothetical protein [Pilimelia sp.]
MIGGPTTGPLAPTQTTRSVPRGVNPVGGVIGHPATSPHGVIGQSGTTTRGATVGAAGSTAPAGGRRPPGTAPGAPARITGITGAPTGSNLSITGAQQWTTARAGRSASKVGPTDPRRRQWDPDNPWEIDQGVDPVILPPPPPPPADPGPVIGGAR